MPTTISPQTSGTPVRAGSSLESLIRLMDGTRTLDMIAEDAGFDPGSTSPLEKVKHRIQQVIVRKHGFGVKVDGKDRLRIMFPKGMSMKNAIIGTTEPEAAPTKRRPAKRRTGGRGVKRHNDNAGGYRPPGAILWPVN